MKNKFLIGCILFLFTFSCDQEEKTQPLKNPAVLEPGVDVVRLPVVVHVLHSGEAIGVGPNLSTERILRQIEILNEDFRRRAGTRGYNPHPDGEDSKIEFALAKFNPASEHTDGINRIDVSSRAVENLGYNQNHFAQYAYWDPSKYINIWLTPLPEQATCIVAGNSGGPLTDLPGTEYLSLPTDDDAEGILINSVHFGESDLQCHARLGRTLTHEMGHYFGLLHPWGIDDCETNDFCDDTPAAKEPIFGRTAYIGCAGEMIMIGNYMNYSDDDVMNIFTKDQVYRMHYVLKNHAGRNKLMTSPAL